MIENSKENLSFFGLKDFKDSNNNHQYPSPSVEKTTLDTRILDAIQRRAVAKLQLQGEDNKPNAEAGCLSLGPAGEAGGCLTLTPAGEAGCLTLGQAGEAGCLSLGHAGEAGACLTIGQSGEPGCLSLGLLNSFTSSSSVSGIPGQPGSNPSSLVVRGRIEDDSWRNKINRISEYAHEEILYGVPCTLYVQLFAIRG